MAFWAAVSPLDVLGVDSAEPVTSGVNDDI